MADTVKVRALKFHTVGGKPYDAGDEYEIEADLLDTVTAQRMAERVHDKAAVVEDAGKTERKDLRAKP